MLRKFWANCSYRPFVHIQQTLGLNLLALRICCIIYRRGLGIQIKVGRQCKSLDWQKIGMTTSTNAEIIKFKRPIHFAVKIRNYNLLQFFRVE